VTTTPTPDAVRSTAATPTLYVVIVALSAGGALLAAAIGPIRDLDIYWHVLLGRELRAGVPVASAGQGWTFAPVSDTWRSTQWLGERAAAWLDAAWGLGAFPVYRVVLVAAALGMLAAVTLRRRPLRAAAWPFLAGAVMLAGTAQERTQQVTFVLAPLVGWWALRVVRDAQAPRWWVLLPVVTVWAAVHGGWVLVPVTLGLAAASRWLDHGWRDPVARHVAVLAVASVAAACVSPSGVDNVLGVLRISRAAAQIAEWGRVTPWDLSALPLVALTLGLVIAWASGLVRPTRGELVLTLTLVGFGFAAWRNLAPAVLVLAPIATAILARACGDADPTTPDATTPDADVARTARSVRWMAWALVSVCALAALSLAVRPASVVDPALPQRLVAEIAATTADQRVLNDYDVAGITLLQGGPPHVRVGIDGRSDLYGADYIHAYQSEMIAGVPGWQEQVARLDPTCALLLRSEPLSELLVAARQWTVVDTEGAYVLLRSPGAPGWPTG
jgi:hypothetical protein